MGSSGGYRRAATRHSTGAAVLAASLLLVAGCSALERQFAFPEGEGLARYLAAPIGESDVADALERRSTVALPARLAVFEFEHTDPDLAPRTNRHVEVLIDRLAADEGRFPSVARISSLLLDGPPELLRLRHAAARSQSDLLLVTEVDRRVESRPTALVFLNLLLIGLVIPSEELTVEIRVQGHLIETDDGFFRGTYRGHAVGEDLVPSLSVESRAEELGRSLVADAYRGLVEDLARRLGPP